MKFPYATLLLALAVASLLLTACGSKATPPAQIACTLDAKICPDGSAVGRQGPNCEFAACPKPAVNASPTPSEVIPEMPEFVPGTTFREYKSTDANMCMRMKFTCDGDEFFGDDTGCGCVRNHNNAILTTCSNEEEKVCGWSNASIQCIAYPCASTYPNLCLASLVQTVAYTTPGECPAPGSAPPSTPPKKLAIDCTEPRTQACTREYMPVCGQKSDGSSITAGNKCTACANNAVISYTEGECAPVVAPSTTPKLQATVCNEPRPEMCTMDYNPVCGQKSNGSTATYGNGCGACGDKDVISHVAGECPQK